MNLREGFAKALHNGICRVTFTKINGEERIMDCTLTERCIPEDKRPKGTGKVRDNEDQLVVYDVEAEGWRTFKIDSVTEFKENIIA